MVLDIVTFPAKRLRNKSEEIKKITPEILNLIEDMKDTLIDTGGYGLAAPQIGRSIRLILVDETACRSGRDAIGAYINPEIISFDGEVLAEEGCLSVPDEYAPVKRAEKIIVKTLDKDGNECIINAEGQRAKIFQHEIDHLNGILFIDHLPSFRKDTLKKHIKRRIKEGGYKVVDK